MPRVLITAFGPYDEWAENSSWLVLRELTRWMESSADITTRLYPVDLEQVHQRLSQDLMRGFDFALHLGQAPGATRIRLEAIAINAAQVTGAGSAAPISVNGPAAYNSTLPLERWAGMLRGKGIPASVTYHAGTYLCNATMYLSHLLAAQRELKLQSTFIHLPLAPEQVAARTTDDPSMSVPMMAAAVGLMIDDLLRTFSPRPVLA
jgi:pyroglutamyl-peptidase